MARLSVDVGVLAFATILSIATGIAFGLVPAIRAVKTDPATVLGAASGVRHPVAMRYALVAFQIALSIVILTGTGLIVRSTQQMSRVDIGLGAGGAGVVWTIVRAVLVTVTFGLVVGLLGALGAHALSAVLFNMSPSDPAALLAGIMILAVVAIVAAVIPAMRATRVDPATVLRYQ